MGSELQLRASDAEREQAAEALRRHHADGRLTTDELEERTGRALAATTRGELERLFDDLPRPRDRQRPPRHARLWPPVIVFPFVAFAIVVSAHALWFIWPLMFFVFFRFVFFGRRHWA
jgi:hypothetical protein